MHSLRTVDSLPHTGWAEETVGNPYASPPGTQIYFVCRSHATQVPIVTIHEERWAYCPGGYVAAKEGHDWAAIEPVRVSDLKPRHVGFAREQQLNRGI